MKKTVFTIGILVCATMLLVLTFPVDKARAQKDKRLHVTPVTRQEDPFVPGRVLVKFRSNVGLDHARQIVAALGARDADEMPQIGVFVLDLPEQADEKAFANALQQRVDVEFAELDRIESPSQVTPNDAMYPDEWHLTKIEAPAAWSSTTGSNTIIVAILDTGVDGTHEDLAGKMVPGWNVYDNNSNASDVYGHGTKVAGTVGASSNNLVGVASIAWNCRLMPIRISDANGTATYSAMANGLTWAADHGARVANISYTASDSSTVRSAAQYFQNRGGVVTASAGNNSTFSSAPDNPYILTVSATDQWDVLSYWSNTGNNIDLAAPEAAYTTKMSGGYTYAGGTSFSAPIVAGVAALVMSANPNLTPQQVQDALKQSADDLGTVGWDVQYGWGRVNARRAIEFVTGGGSPTDTTPPSVGFIGLYDGTTVSGIVAVSATANDNLGVTSVTFAIDGMSSGEDTSSPYGFTWDTRVMPNGIHTLTATAKDAAGNAATATISVVVSNIVDTIPPAVSITTPSDGAKVGTNVAVTVNANDNVGVTRVELYVDGRLQSSSAAAPFTIKWNTAKATKGAHTLQCKAYDAVGNAGLSSPVGVYK
jgi:thermitase